MIALLTTYQILYNNKNITNDISDHIISLAYTDKVEGESDELEIMVDDKDALWQNEWYPEKGATIEARIIEDGASLPCGKFTIDEISLAGSKDGGDTVTISCLAAFITKKLRTKKNTAHENKTLRQLATSVAVQHGLTVQGTIPDIRFGRITQNVESDLSFLNRISRQYGLVFSIRDTLLVFQSQKELESKVHVLSIDKTDCTDYSFTDKNEKTYKKAKVKYHNPETNTVVEHTEDADDNYTGGEDELTIRDKVENKQQAQVLAESKLYRANKKEQTVSITAPGNVLLLSGSNVEVTGFGKLSGIYHITEAGHSLTRDGYTVAFEGKRVNMVNPAKYKPKRKSRNGSHVSATNNASILLGPLGNSLSLINR